MPSLTLPLDLLPEVVDAGEDGLPVLAEDRVAEGPVLQRESSGQDQNSVHLHYLNSI